MKLPNHDRAIVPKEKITDYLLSPVHADGRTKAAFFFLYGFTAENWQEMASALQRQAAELEIVRVEETPFGMRYIIEGIIDAPDRRKPVIRSVWFIERGEETPRFVTAYPLKGREP